MGEVWLTDNKKETEMQGVPREKGNLAQLLRSFYLIPPKSNNKCLKLVIGMGPDDTVGIY